MHTVLDEMGVVDSSLYRFIAAATASGEVSVFGPKGPEPAFSTSRGIRQGCPVSPILFALVISGIERYLLERHPSAGVVVGESRRLMVSYADDIQLLCSSEEELQEVFASLCWCLAQLGLQSEASKCCVLGVGVPSGVTSVTLDGHVLELSE